MVDWRGRYHVLLCLCLVNGIYRSNAQSMTEPSLDLGGGEDFQEADQLRNPGASWSLTLTVDIGTVTYNWLELKRRMYNGKITGPTITVKQGDTLTVNLTNRLSAEGNDLGRPLNKDNYPNSTNLHTHGLHISSQDPQDNVLVRIDPGTSKNYEYKIHRNQPAGTYWYHAHLHGSTMFQVAGGLAGMLIVEDNVANMTDELNAVSCPNNCDKDIQMLFQPILIFNGSRGFGTLQNTTSDYEGFRHDSYITNPTTRETLTDWLAENVNNFTTNGQLQPNLEMTAGQMYRFRMVNAGGGQSLEVYIVGTDNTATTKCDIREIAVDGVYLDEPRTMHDGQSFLSPGNRVDWLVKCNVAGTYKVRSFADVTQNMSIGEFRRFTGDLVSLTVSGIAVDPVQDFPSKLPTRPQFVFDLRNIAEADIEERFVVELNPSFHLNRELWRGGDYYRYKMTVGKIQEWNLLNANAEFSHPLHIHVNHFQIISYDKYTGGYTYGGSNWEFFEVDNQADRCHYQRAGFNRGQGKTGDLTYLGHDKRYAADAGNTLGYARVGEWRDTVLVPPLANITIRFKPHEHTGAVIIHCHILDHEDAGMMMVTEIVEEDESTEANIRSGDAYPGTCRACDRYPFNNSTRLCDKAACGGAQRKIFSLSLLLACLIVSFRRKLLQNE